MDPASAARVSTQTVEARAHDLPRAARTRTLARRSRQSRWERTTLVEKLGNGHPHRPPGEPLRPPRVTEACHVTSTLRTAGCGPARPVVWEGPDGAKPVSPYPILSQRPRIALLAHRRRAAL